MVIKSYHIILAVKILGWFLLKWAGFGELLGWKSSTRSGNTDCILVCLRSHYEMIQLKCFLNFNITEAHLYNTIQSHNDYKVESTTL